MDSIASYCALRQIGVQGEKFVLNNRPYQLRMALDGRRLALGPDQESRVAGLPFSAPFPQQEFDIRIRGGKKRHVVGPIGGLMAASLRDSIGDLLRQKGYAVVTAEDGNAALATLARSDTPCIVLLDLVMPGMDGWKFLAIVQANPQTATIPIVIASAHAATHAPTGIAGILHKPFDLDELFATVARHCGPPGSHP